MSPAVALPSMSNLDPADLNSLYEQYIITKQSYEVATFRFNVSKCSPTSRRPGRVAEGGSSLREGAGDLG